VSSPERLLSCLVPQGLGSDLRARIFSELRLTRVDLHSARGFMGSDPGGLFNRVERDIVSVVVEAEQADEVFDWLYHEAEVGTKEGRFLYMTRLDRSTPFTLPDEVPMEV
jgi:hypothetical protein